MWSHVGCLTPDEQDLFLRCTEELPAGTKTLYYNILGLQGNPTWKDCVARAYYLAQGATVKMLNPTSILAKHLERYGKDSTANDLNYKVQIEKLYQVQSNDGSFANEFYGLRQLSLWHGTPTQNIYNIIRNGVLIRPESGKLTLRSIFPSITRLNRIKKIETHKNKTITTKKYMNLQEF
jgi:hypothetical protein